MSNLPKVLTGLAALAFVLAVVANFAGALMHVGAEGFSRASTNLALLAVAFIAISRDRGVVAGGSATLP